MAGDVPVYEGRPDRIYEVVDFVGELFLFGAAGGSAIHFVKGLHGSPGGARLAGAVHAVRANVPRVAGKFGAYCVALTAIEGAVSLARGKDRDGTRGCGCGCGFGENPPAVKPAGLEKTRPRANPRVHFCTRTRTRGFRAGFGCPRI